RRVGSVLFRGVVRWMEPHSARKYRARGARSAPDGADVADDQRLEAARLAGPGRRARARAAAASAATGVPVDTAPVGLKRARVSFGRSRSARVVIDTNTPPLRVAPMRPLYAATSAATLVALCRRKPPRRRSILSTTNHGP